MAITLERRFTFAGGDAGQWRIEQCRAIAGESLAPAAWLSIAPASTPLSGATTWALHGIVSNERYVEREERNALVSRQEGLGRPESTCAALIPIRKSPSWWALAQDERRQILETQSRHIGIGLAYLPGIARRLHHCRDLDTDQPFDFLTWFEFASSEAARFDELLAALRATAEWQYVDREVEVRVVREGL